MVVYGRLWLVMGRFVVVCVVDSVVDCVIYCVVVCVVAAMWLVIVVVYCGW